MSELTGEEAREEVAREAVAWHFSATPARVAAASSAAGEARNRRDGWEG